MGKSIIVGDIHLIDKGDGYIDFQTKTIIDLVNSDDYFAVVFLGDIFDKRKPSPTELLRFNDILSSIKPSKKYIIRGNHESETRSDNGVTVLSLFHNINKGIHVYEHTSRACHKGFPKTTFIPHYEDPTSIISSLENVPSGDLVFGHFGFSDDDSCSFRDNSSIHISNFNNFTILGHIHRYNRKGSVLTLGTPYTVNFGEHKKECYYGIIHHNEEEYVKFTKKKVNAGIKHIVTYYEDLPKYNKYFKDPNYFTIVKLLLTRLDEDTSFAFKNKILEKYNIDKLDMAYNPIITNDKNSGDVSTFKPDKKLFTIDDTIINDYITKQTTDLDSSDIRKGYELLSKKED
jgi:hypothetical protein